MASQIKGLTDCDETYEAAVSTNATPTCGAPSDTSAPPRLQLIVCCGSILVYFGLFWSILVYFGLFSGARVEASRPDSREAGGPCWRF